MLLFIANVVELFTTRGSLHCSFHFLFEDLKHGSAYVKYCLSLSKYIAISILGGASVDKRMI